MMDKLPWSSRCHGISVVVMVKLARYEFEMLAVSTAIRVHNEKLAEFDQLG